MTLGDQLRRHVRNAIDAARGRAATRGSRIRVVDSANVVVARNIGAKGASQGASAHQSVVVRNGSIQQRTEQTTVGEADRGKEQPE